MPYTNRFPTGSYEFEPADNARASLLASITAASISIQLQNLASSDAYVNFPTGASGTEAPYIVTIENEQILIYSKSGDTLTVWQYDVHGAYGTITGAGETGRGYAGTSAAAHTIPSGGSIVVYQYIVAEHIEQMQDAIALLQTNKPEDSDVVHDTGNETVAGIKTFSAIPILPSANPTADNQSARKKYVDDTIGALNLLGFGGDGSDGVLNITSGVTNIALNTVKNYSSISITGTATLSTSDVATGIMLLNSTGNVTISSTLGIDTSEICYIANASLFTLLSGDTLTANPIVNGGAGRAGGSYAPGVGGAGGAQGSGYGGGGGGGSSNNYNGGIGGAGGAGGGTGGAHGNASNGSDGGTSAGGGGGDDGANTSGDGADAYGIAGGDSTGVSTGGGGGSGGTPTLSKSGMPIVINTSGNIDLSGTEIKTSGGAGGAGGRGGVGNTGAPSSGSGGGGGGGSGGAGGADIIIKYTGSYVGATTETLDGGAGGAGGAGGTVAGGGGTSGLAGLAGTAGTAGGASATNVNILF